MKILDFGRFRRRRTSGNDYITALDIGTSNVCCVIARLESPSKIRVLGCGQQAAKGLRNGHIIDMENVELSILKAVHVAEQMAEETIQEVYVNLSYCQSHSVSVEIPISGHAVDDADLKRLIVSAHQVREADEFEPIHTIPTSYDLDGRSGIHDPRGMYGERLGVNVHSVYASVSDLRNISTAISRCHLEAKAFVNTAYASGLATLVEDECQLGGLVIDMGAGTTNFGLFYEGHLIYTDCLPIGGAHITSDIARVLSTPLLEAERLKTLYGSVISSALEDGETLRVPQIGERDDENGTPLAKAELMRVIRPRAEEVFELVRTRLATKGFQTVGGHVILTGGGSQLTGLPELASHILGRQARCGRILPLFEGGSAIKAPTFATALGTLAYVQMSDAQAQLGAVRSSSGLFSRVGGWMKENV